MNGMYSLNMTRGRPRKAGKRKPGGRLEKIKKKDERYETANYRMRDFEVSKSLSINPLAGYLAGVLYLRGKIEARHLGHYFSFLQLSPNTIRASPIIERVQGGRPSGYMINRRYERLAKYLGRGIDALHELSRDRLVVPVNTLKILLEKVPLTRGGSRFMNWCENQHPRNTR